jgi:cytochrome c-type biogenesis protein CcmH
MLWMILTLMTVLAAVGLAIPLIRRHDAARAPRNEVVEILKGQIGEIDAQAAQGVLPPEEAQALKTDVQRRVLAEGRAAPEKVRPLGEKGLLALALGLAAVVVLAATGLYLKMGRPEVASAPLVPGAAATQGSGTAAAGADAAHPNGDVASMISQLEAHMKETPGDADGWRMLGWSYLQTGRNADAAAAYGRAAALDPKNPEYLSAQGEATVLAAQGQVTPEAEAAFRKAVVVDPADPRARYYLAMAKDQKGDHKGAMDDWINMIRTAPADAAWAAEVRSFVEKTAQSRGEDISARLPPVKVAPVAAPALPPGPTADQVAAAGQMTDDGRQAMIKGMVEQLSARLKANPRDREGWERLIRSRMVLGQPGLATAAYREAIVAFAGSPSDLAALKSTATGLGVPGV